MMQIKYYIFLILFFKLNSLFAQESNNELGVQQVIELVRQFHPIVRQSNIGIETSEANILNAKGNFDPLLNSYLGQKTFNGTNYYNNISTELKIPTWYGMDVYAGVDYLTGNRLDPTMSSGQSSYLGLNVPLVKNLLLDKRRAFLQQAKIYNSMSKADQMILINNILMDAISAYWSWVNAYESYKIIEQNVLINNKRLDLIKKSVLNGERPEIDIVEANTQLQSFEYIKNERWLAFQNAGLSLSAYLWKNSNIPFQLPESVVPQKDWDNELLYSIYDQSLTNLISVANHSHPELVNYNYKLDILKIEKKLKFQELLPKVDFKYNFLTKGYGIHRSLLDASLFQNNYQYGVKMELPLFFSQGRANYKLAKLKIEDTNLDKLQKQRTIELKIKHYYNEYLNLKNQSELQTKNFDNYQKLLNAELIRFQNGESSLFLINSRENKTLEVQEKLIEIKTKYFKSIFALQWSAGVLK